MDIKLTFRILSWLLLLPSCAGYEVLMICANIKSHCMYFSQLARVLTSHQHHVTFAMGSTFQVPDFISEMDDVSIETYNLDDTPFVEKPETVDLFIQAIFNSSFLESIARMKAFQELSLDELAAIVKDDKFMKRIAELNFDFAVIDLPFMPYYIIPHNLGIPFAVLGVECSINAFRTPWNPSYIPHFFNSIQQDDMTFYERFKNTVLYMVVTPMESMLFVGDTKALMAKYTPSIEPLGSLELHGKASLCLRLREIVLETTRPLPPNYINVGGIIGRPGRALSGDIQSFVTSSKNGIILVSFGSWMNSLPDDISDKMIKGFKATEYSFVWKTKGVHINDDQIITLPWIPQNDLLGNLNIRGFVSHCGISSMNEAIYHGVPILCMPFALNQGFNAQIIKGKGYGDIINIKDFSPSELAAKIEMLTSEKYINAVKRASNIFKELPSGGDNFVFWMEHIIKYGDDNIRLRAQDMSWFQYALVDVLLVLVAFLTGVVIFCCKCFRYICRKWCRKRQTKQKRE